MPKNLLFSSKMMTNRWIRRQQGQIRWLRVRTRPQASFAAEVAHAEGGAASVPSLSSSDRAEAIIDDSTPVVAFAAEAGRIKAVLTYHGKSEAALVEKLLRRLQQLEFTVHALKGDDRHTTWGSVNQLVHA